jgi:UDP-N-acetylmuramate dehydrogenase
LQGGVDIQGTRVTLGPVAMMALVVTKMARAGLTGFEWAIGVPGTVGGSVRGNAGCFGGEMGQVVESVRYIDMTNGQPQELSNAGCEFSYRDSVFKRHPEWMIVSVTLNLCGGDPKKVQEEVKRITLERTRKQDIGTKSCGCIFKNVSWSRRDIDKEKLLARHPELAQFSNNDTIPASFLIDAAGLKGRRAGRAFVSPKHANFFVNEGSATAEEVIMLISLTKDTVKRKFGIILEEEIQYVGFE